MKDRQDRPLSYELVIEKPLVSKVIPGGDHISKFLSQPLRPIVDFLLLHRPAPAQSDNYPNPEVFRGYEQHFLNLGVRTVTQIRDLPRKLRNIKPESFSSFRNQELESGVTKIQTRVKGRKVTAFIAPSDFVPYSFRADDIFPDKEGQVPVSASLRKIAKSVRDDKEFPAVAMTAASWNHMVIFGDIVYVKSLDETPVQENVRKHIKETLVGIDTRSAAPYFTFEDFFDALHNPPIRPGEADRTTKTPWLPNLDAHWLITQNDGSIHVMSATELKRADDQQDDFRKKIASITSTAAFVNEAIAAEYADHKDLPVQLVNAIVLFTLNRERRIGSIHGTLDTNAITMFKLAKHIIGDQLPGAEDIEIAVVDGGGSSGAIVQKGTEGQQRFDKSTLPSRMIEHEIPIFTGLVHKNYVTKE